MNDIPISLRYGLCLVLMRKFYMLIKDGKHNKQYLQNIGMLALPLLPFPAC